MAYEHKPDRTLFNHGGTDGMAAEITAGYSIGLDFCSYSVLCHTYVAAPIFFVRS